MTNEQIVIEGFKKMFIEWAWLPCLIMVIAAALEVKEWYRKKSKKC